MKKWILIQNYLQMPTQCEVDSDLITNVNHKPQIRFQSASRHDNTDCLYHWSFALHKKCPYSELFWSVLTRIRTEYGEIPKNESQNNTFYGVLQFMVNKLHGV